MKKLFFLPALLLVAACNLGGQMKDVLSLSQEIKDKYKCSPGIKLDNGNSIEITLENSSWNDSSDEVKQRVSDEIGRIVMSHKKLSKSLTEGTTIFSNTTNAVVVHVERNTSFSMHLQKI